MSESGSTPALPDPVESDVAPDSGQEHYYVGIGASAGGLEAMTELLKHLGTIGNLTLVFAQHLEAKRESQLVELLARHTPAPVEWARHGDTLERGRIYVVPPKTRFKLQQHVILLERSGAGVGDEINAMLRSLAEDTRDCAVGILLSGTGSDGTLGLRAIKRVGGTTFAQEPTTATYPDMPRAAIEARCVDRVLSPTGIAKELVKLAQDAERLSDRFATPGENQAENLAMVFRILAMRTGVDFSDYKQSTVHRRLLRRMAMAKVADLADYVRLLNRNRQEVIQLYDSLLINVTEFFRDPETFNFLRTAILPALLEGRRPDDPLRIWVPGCSTGEEVYSLAMVAREVAESRGVAIPVQVFGTDISDHAIATARAGVYPMGDVANVSAERLQRFFYQTDSGYGILKPIRDLCVFARQNVVKDPPFSRLDLISCRNLMIYFGPKLQRKLMPLFHYALNPEGYLMLGSSESVGSYVELFRLVDRQHRIYSRKTAGRRTSFEYPYDYSSLVAAYQPVPSYPAMPGEVKEPSDITREAERILLARHVPAGVLVNEGLDIVQFRGDVSPYLSPGAGKASLSLLKMARDGLATDLQMAVRECATKGGRQCRRAVTTGEKGPRLVEVDVTALDSGPAKDRYYLIVFSPLNAAPEAAGNADQPLPPSEATQAEQLRQDLDATRSFLQTTVERHEATNQELRAANEEIQSSNEELQSTNEELETAKEELQSANEELTTVNEELHSRQMELVHVNNDLHNLINSAHLPIVILGQDLRIRRFTQMAGKVLKLIPTDVGRPFSDINIDIAIADLPRMVAEVLETFVMKDVEVQDSLGRWYSLRLRPYKTSDNKIEGVVLTLIDIHALKQAHATAEEARLLAQAAFDSSHEPLVALTADLRVESANEAFYRLFNTSKERAEGRSFFDAVNHPEKLAPLRQALEGIIPTNTCLTNYEVSVDLPAIGPTTLTLDVRRIASAGRKFPLLLIALRQT